jgi:hypothetical protein
MKLNDKQRRMLYAWCMEEGLSIEYGKLSLCDLSGFRYSQLSMNRRWQVHSDDSKHSWSMIYDELEPAIEKFLELKQKVKRLK